MVVVVNFCSLRFLISSCSAGSIPEALGDADSGAVEVLLLLLGPALELAAAADVEGDDAFT